MSLVPSRRQPLHCVWEITLACSCRCRHCGSSAGAARPDELTTKEALELIGQLEALGTQTVTLSGGEPLLRSDWPEIAETIRGAGMTLELMTNGLHVVDQADDIARAGFQGVSFSVDGPESIHDELRQTPGALKRLLKGADALRQRSVRIGAVTQVNRMNLDKLEATHGMIVKRGFEGWLVQLTLPIGRAGSSEGTHQLCLEPSDLPALEAFLVSVAERGEVLLQTADTIGYMSPNEPRFRTSGKGRRQIWGSCQAGLRVVGITSSGAVRGCLSMPSAFDEGHLRDRTLEEIWNAPESFSYNRRFDVASLEGACAECAFGPLCRGGCTSLAWVTTGRTTGNPFCLRSLASPPVAE